MINQRLFDWYNIDTTKNLGIDKVCARPFDTLLIDKNGNSFLCECTSWLPQSVGNLQIQSIEEILKNKITEKIRQSVMNKKYNFCNEHQCPYIKSKSIKTTNDEKIKFLRLAIDDSCNLKCPSCRTKKIFYHTGRDFERRMSMAKKIINFLNTLKHEVTINLGSDGDPFASLIYRYILRNISNKKNVKVNIQTNGLLIKKFHARHKNLFHKLETLNISIDGTSKEVYDKLRLGGNWEQLYENLKYLSNIDRSFKIYLHMVVQQDNWHQMRQLLQIADKFNFDRVYFNPIQNWNTNVDFSKQNYQKNEEFLKEISAVKKHKKSRLWSLS